MSSRPPCVRSSIRRPTPGLTDRLGNQTSPRNDGTTNPQVTQTDLFIDALKGIDAAFAAAPDGDVEAQRRGGARARSSSIASSR